MTEDRDTRDDPAGAGTILPGPHGRPEGPEAEGNDPVRVLLVDDGPEFVSAVIAFFRDLREADLVGVAPCRDVAERYVARLAPDLVLLSLTLPDRSGLEVVERLGGRDRVPVVVLALDDAEAYRIAAQRAGAIELVAWGDFVARLPSVIQEFSRTRKGDSTTRCSPRRPGTRRGETGATRPHGGSGIANKTRAKTGEIP